MWLMIINTCYSQFNDSTHYHIKYLATGIINKTNQSSSFVLNNSFAFGVNHKKITVNTLNTWIYGQQNSRMSNNDFSSFFNFDYLKESRKIYYWGLTSFVTSYSLNINRQLQTGAGIGYNIINKKNAELVVSDGILYEASDLVKSDTVREKYQTVRNSLRIKHRWMITERVTMEGVHFWQPSFERFDDYIFRTDFSVVIKLRKWLSLTSMVTFNRISRTDRENLLINFGLIAENYF
ncbi:MAG: DUF481 domain-containing protein [Bacteroidetes bacterium]|nr:DUF481 domain-containing protein [Bacteroidota bacterium]MBS1609714.1 DUF481 domain-containing protein [Bacteroidota bacterium]